MCVCICVSAQCPFQALFLSCQTHFIVHIASHQRCAWLSAAPNQSGQKPSYRESALVNNTYTYAQLAPGNLEHIAPSCTLARRQTHSCCSGVWHCGWHAFGSSITQFDEASLSPSRQSMKYQKQHKHNSRQTVHHRKQQTQSTLSL